MYHYPSPHPGWSSYDYMTSPPTSPHYAFYATQFASPYASPRGPSKRHNRKASYAGTKETSGWYSGYGQGVYEAMPEHGTPPRKHDPVPAHDDVDSAKRSRARRQSTSTRTPSKPKPEPAAKPPPKATEEDAARAGIPPGYSIKNWDPTEMPIILLGSVFDANSLGKWIYDWTVFHHGASTPMADVAGDLWLLLIKLAGKVKRADECVDRIKRKDAHEVVEDFLESGERLWARFKKLLKTCEQFMWKAAKREGGKTVSMGRNAGCEFVETIFGRDRELESTEKLMNSIRLWNMRFDANCEEILRRPSAA
ncbi:vegetative cell wall protein gp1 [Aspergillus sclerotiicarbonarius CBS 121057]|uniref:Vegetative cell wall protein gp1 n=1 Tax=Aspergillus sclerotiicarbonarius (strain CBS 121057 / IBT 28362) TaxID=1448318 RepID=A0A319E3B8_ASPSB|nr:vegetative cell wall protein gp1 [Aspergillus sclerotiicarbonarius CBS 121057]